LKAETGLQRQGLSSRWGAGEDSGKQHSAGMVYMTCAV